MTMHQIARRFTVKAIKEDGTFTGMASVFGAVDHHDDIVAPGAFAACLDGISKGAMNRPPMLWQHWSDQPIGVFPSLAETAEGLECEGKLALRTQMGAECYELMKMGAISGLSIGGYTRADSMDAKSGVRTINEFELWEISVVTFPANDGARIAQVKTIEEIGDLAGAERYLREVGRLPRSQAKAMVNRFLELSRREVGSTGNEEAKAITELLRARAAIFAPAA
jgi:HK97 family phage prohead protease